MLQGNQNIKRNSPIISIDSNWFDPICDPQIINYFLERYDHKKSIVKPATLFTNKLNYVAIKRDKSLNLVSVRSTLLIKGTSICTRNEGQIYVAPAQKPAVHCERYLWTGEFDVGANKVYLLGKFLTGYSKSTTCPEKDN